MNDSIKSEKRANSNSPVVIVLPHWRIEGGASFYIRDLLQILARHARIRVAGRHGADYDASPVSSTFLDKLGALSFPAYEGIQPAATLFHLLRSCVQAFKLLATPRRLRFRHAPSAFVFTSSVQALSIPVTRHFYPETKIVIAVQEQVNLSKIFGRSIAWLLRRSDVVLAITDGWATHARGFGIDPIVVRNQYRPSFADPKENGDPAIASDLLYVGGGARIKGFDELTAALPTLLERPGLRVLCLGSYDHTARNTLERIGARANPGSHLGIVGLVPDIRPYLRGTKLLLLPIGSPHFCRPAIEAGFFGKAFVIPDFPGLEDFVKAGQNCETYEPGNIENLVLAVSAMLDDEHARTRMSCANWHIAQGFRLKAEDGNALLNNLWQVGSREAVVAPEPGAIP